MHMRAKALENAGGGAAREGEMERRGYRRRDCRADIEWSYFNRRERFRGLMRNYSESGAYIETEQEIKAGANILIHTGRVMIACENEAGCIPPNATLLAEIKWQGRVPADDDRCYGAGIRYHL